MNNLKQKLKELNTCIQKYKEIANQINIMDSEYDDFLISNHFNLDIIDQKQTMNKILYQKELHNIYDILKDTNINKVYLEISYESDDQGGSYKCANWSIEESDDDDMIEDICEQLNNHIDSDFFEDGVIDITPIRALYENKKILETLEIEHKIKTKISKV